MNWVPYVYNLRLPAMPILSVSMQAELTDRFLAVMAPLLGIF
jgi:hypothetical protein